MALQDFLPNLSSSLGMRTYIRGTRILRHRSTRTLCQVAKVSEGSFAATQGTKCTKKGKGLAVGIGGIGMFSYELLDVPRHKIQTGHLLVALNGVETPDLTPDTFKPDSHGVMKQQMQQAHCLSTDLHLHVLGCESRTEAELESQTGQFRSQQSHENSIEARGI